MFPGPVNRVQPARSHYFQHEEGKNWCKDEAALTMLTHAAYAISAILNLGLRMPWGNTVNTEGMNLSWLPKQHTGEDSQDDVSAKK